jgi:hypothetical protein
MYATRLRLFALIIYSTLLGPCTLRCQTPQTVDLTGTVVEAVTQKAIDGVDVVLRSPSGGLLGKVVTGTDGKFKASDLKAGDSVTIYYQHGGYLPRPAGPVTVVLVIGTNVKNLQLMMDSRDMAYWSQWAKQTKYSVGAQATNIKQKDALYDQLWSLLGVYGFSPVSQALAARQLAEVTPEAFHSRQLMSFATVDLDVLQQADSSIRAAVDGHGELYKYLIPSDVAVAIASSEFEKRGFTTPPSEFMQRFGAVWGDQATGDLSNALSASPTKAEIGKMWDKARPTEATPF